MEHTIAVDQSITPGVKTLDIVLVDEFGNKHNTSVDVEVQRVKSQTMQTLTGMKHEFTLC